MSGSEKRSFARGEETSCSEPSLFDLQLIDGELVNVSCGKKVIIYESEAGFVSFEASRSNRAIVNIFCKNPGRAEASICSYEWNPEKTDINARFDLNLYYRQDSRRIPLLLQGDKVLVAIDIEHNVLYAEDNCIWFTRQTQLLNRIHEIKPIPEKPLVQPTIMGSRTL